MFKRNGKSHIVLAGAALFCGAMTAMTYWPQADNKPVTKSEDRIVTGSTVAVKKGASGLPLPRFVSLKSDRINVRSGPGQDYPVSWIFTRAGMPVEIVAEYDNWRRIRDSEGAEGWVYHSLLSGRRTGMVTPWEGPDKTHPMFSGPQTQKPVVANLQAAFVVSIGECDGEWCEISARDISGYIPQKQIWGVYPKEEVGS